MKWISQPPDLGLIFSVGNHVALLGYGVLATLFGLWADRIADRIAALIIPPLLSIALVGIGSHT